MSTKRMLTITVVREATQNEIHRFEGTQTVTVGKDATCDLVLSDRGVSRKHCRIAVVQSDWTVCDLGSTNGLKINGKSLVDVPPEAPVALCNGDTIGVGLAVLKIEINAVTPDATEVLTPQSMAERAKPATELLEPKLVSAKRSVVASPLNHAQTFLVQPEKSTASPQKGSSTRSTTSPSGGRRGSSGSRQVTRQFRSYSLRKKIGVGGMGDVFLAIDNRSQATLAIKFLQPHAAQSPPERQRFLREMDIALKLKHRFLVECFECGEEAGRLFLTMAYCNGGNLSNFLVRTGKLNVRRSVRLMYRLLAGVDAAHQQGIVHRDLKPSNILLHREADGLYVPKISDFGLAKSFLGAGESGMTLNGTVAGSWDYMPKEQVIDFRFVLPQSDVWSLGAIMYESVTNQLPRPITKGQDPIRTIIESKLVPIEKVQCDLPQAFRDFLSTALEVETKNRFRDAGEMRTALQVVADKIGVEL